MKSKQHSLTLVVCGFIAASLCFGTSQILAGTWLPAGADSPTSNEKVSNASGSALMLDAAKLMSRVGAKYGDLASYKCRGESQHRSTFDGSEKSDPPISFELKYARGGSSFIKWEQDDQKKIFTTLGDKSWLDVDGRRVRDFSSPADGLMIISSAKAGWSLFGINFFVFREELKLGSRFFLGLTSPFTVEERKESGRSYCLLTGSFRNVNVKETYWIDQETYLITKIERVLVVRTIGDDKEYVSEERTVESYSDIEINTTK